MTAADERLRESVEREVLACIGCNDCLLACPINESRPRMGVGRNADRCPLVRNTGIGVDASRRPVDLDRRVASFRSG